MGRIMEHRPSPSLAISVLALVVASVGTASALPGKGSVKANDLAKGAVHKRAIKADAVTERAIAPGAVGAAELADGAVGAEKLGPVSAVTGPLVASTDDLADDGLWTTLSSAAQCPPGSKLIGGGFRAFGAGFGTQTVHVQTSAPENDRWSAEGVADDGPGVGSIEAYAVCLD